MNVTWLRRTAKHPSSYPELPSSQSDRTISDRAHYLGESAETCRRLVRVIVEFFSTRDGPIYLFRLIVGRDETTVLLVYARS